MECDLKQEKDDEEINKFCQNQKTEGVNMIVA